MTLDEAIKHAEEVTDEKQKEACNLYEAKNYEESRECIWCAEEHRQLAEWLKELKHLRNLVAYSIDFHCTIEKAEKKLRVAEDKIAYIESLNKGEV